MKTGHHRKDQLAEAQPFLQLARQNQAAIGSPNRVGEVGNTALQMPTASPALVRYGARKTLPAATRAASDEASNPQ